MSVSASDIIVYGSQNMAESDSGTQGGSIDTAVRVVFADLAANDTITIVSTAGDTGTVAITGRNAAGSIASETLTLNGTNSVAGSTTFERVLKIVCTSHSGVITVSDTSDATQIVQIESSVTTIRRPFYSVSADTVDGSNRTFYEKVFIKNTNGSSDLLSASISEQSDGVDGAGSGSIDFDLEIAKNDANTATNRITAPASSGLLGSGTFSSSPKSVPGTDLASSEVIGVWLKLNLPKGTAAANTSYTLRITGSTA
jgi:hypothetical protein|tara:strand:+ start:213 stop:980 length:768 start_codon:yes stop_codon:yes gene_type:complete